MKDCVFLLVAHFYSDDLLIEFFKLQDAVGNNCFLLYHHREGRILDDRIFTLPHFIVTRNTIQALGYRPLVAGDSLVPGSNHFPLIRFSREYPCEQYWYIEYDVRFTGNWRKLFDYFNEEADFIAAHIRWYKEEPKWFWWNALYHPGEQIAPENRLRSFNPIYRISSAAIKHIDEMHRAGWVGHHEVLIPTLLQQHGFKLRDFGGRGTFVRPEDQDKFYIDSTSYLLLDGSLCYRNQHLGYEMLKDKIFHPIKGYI